MSVVVAAITCLLFAGAGAQPAAAAPPLSGKKVLIVYLSRTNNTKAIADFIHQEVGGTIVALELESPYPADYRATVRQVVREDETGYLPPLKTKIDNIVQYDVVFVGFPTWAMQLPPPVKSFLRQYSLRGKTVIPFNTNDGYGTGSSFQTVKELCPQSTVLEGFTTRGGMDRDGRSPATQGARAAEAQNDVKSWLRKLDETLALTNAVGKGAPSTWTESSETQSIVITRGGSRPVRQAPAATFTGSARVEMLFEPLGLSDLSGGAVTFEPGARTAWHSHPRGQILIVTAGTGRVQRWGGHIEEIRAGDVVKIPAGEKHWHGASPQASMSHIAISEQRDGSVVQWMEKVSDDEYNGVASVSDGGGQLRAQSPGPSEPRPQSPTVQPGADRPSGSLQQKVAPGMAVLTDDVLYGDVWKRSELSPRDRSLVTITALIATGKPAPLAGHLGRALDNGLQPGEASGLLAHLAIYCGWPNAVAALEAYDQVYTARKIDTAALSAVAPRLAVPPSDAAQIRGTTDALTGVAPKFVQLTNDVVFDDLWRRSDLSVRDRSLVTIVALAAMGDDDQLEAYVRLGLASGLTRAQIVEAVTHLGFYSGWSRATKAMTALTKSLGK